MAVMGLFEFELLLRLLLAAVLGALIGAQRERLSRGAGFRTQALVSTASALVMIVSIYGFMDVLSPGRVVLDPSRVAAQVISGVGFLGAGTIIFRKNAVRGLTTAASIWAVAGIGLACGAGLYIASIGATLILSVILTGLKKLEEKYFPMRQINVLTIGIVNAPGRTKSISQKFKIDGLKVLNMSIKHAKNSGRSVIKIEAAAQEHIFVGLLDELQALPGVESVEYDGHALPLEDAHEPDYEDEQSAVT
jgi:putative Mg2+ transporter-C (MgtC) family protein